MYYFMQLFLYVTSSLLTSWYSAVEWADLCNSKSLHLVCITFCSAGTSSYHPSLREIRESNLTTTKSVSLTLFLTGHLSEHIGSLCLSSEYSDLTLIVEGQRIPAHKVILAASSDYFRALLYGGMRESNQVFIVFKF